MLISPFIAIKDVTQCWIHLTLTPVKKGIIYRQPTKNVSNRLSAKTSLQCPRSYIYVLLCWWRKHMFAWFTLKRRQESNWQCGKLLCTANMVSFTQHFVFCFLYCTHEQFSSTVAQTIVVSLRFGRKWFFIKGINPGAWIKPKDN